MTVLDVVKSAALRTDLDVPSVVFASTDRTMMEVGDMLNTCARQILDEYDWQALKKIGTLTGDGTVEEFDLPADYDRMTRDARLWTESAPHWNVGQISPEGWLALDNGMNLSWRSLWTIFGSKLHIRTAPYADQDIRFFYISNAIVNGTDPQQFTADTDSFVLDERLLKLCFVWNWRKQKGFDYAADLQEYQDALAYAIGKDKGPRRIYGNSGGYVPDIFAAVWGR